jgi:hypothetical protein
MCESFNKMLATGQLKDALFPIPSVVPGKELPARVFTVPFIMIRTALLKVSATISEP